MKIKINFLFFIVGSFCLIQENNLLFGSEIFKAITNGNIANFKKELRRNPKVIHENGGTRQIKPLPELPYHHNYPFIVKAIPAIAKYYFSPEDFQRAAHDAYWNAAQNDNMPFIRLLSLYTKITPDLINQKDHKGNTLMHIIAKLSNFHDHSSSARKQHRKALRIFQKMDANTFEKNYQGKTPADLAKHSDIKEILS